MPRMPVQWKKIIEKGNKMDTVVGDVWELTATQLFLAAYSEDPERRTAALSRIHFELTGGSHRDWSLDIHDYEDQGWIVGHLNQLALRNPSWQLRLGEALGVVLPRQERILSLDDLRAELRHMDYRMVEYQCAYRHPALLKAMQFVAILSMGEVECALRCIRDNQTMCCEAVDHFGGHERLYEQAVKRMRYDRAMRRCREYERYFPRLVARLKKVGFGTDPKEPQEVLRQAIEFPNSLSPTMFLYDKYRTPWAAIEAAIHARE